MCISKVPESHFSKLKKTHQQSWSCRKFGSVFRLQSRELGRLVVRQSFEGFTSWHQNQRVRNDEKKVLQLCFQNVCPPILFPCCSTNKFVHFQVFQQPDRWTINWWTFQDPNKSIGFLYVFVQILGTVKAIVLGHRQWPCGDQQQGADGHGALGVEGRHVEQVQQNFNHDQHDDNPLLKLRAVYFWGKELWLACSFSVRITTPVESVE